MFSQDRLKRIASLSAAILHRVLGDRDRGQLGMLLHHQVMPIRPGIPAPPYNVPPDTFRAQLIGLIAAGYRFVRLREALDAARTRRPLAPHSVVLTFDDVYESVYHYAFPMMRDLGVPGVALLSTSFLDSVDPFPFDAWAIARRDRLSPEEYRPLRTEQCREMLRSGIFELGAHTHTHRDLRCQPEAYRGEVAKSAEIVRKLFGLDEIPFAFPWGSTSRGFAGSTLRTAVREAGVSCALTTDSKLIDPLTDDLFDWGRFVVYAWDTPATLAAKLAGWYSWPQRLKKLSYRRQVTAPLTESYVFDG